MEEARGHLGKSVPVKIIRRAGQNQTLLESIGEGHGSADPWGQEQRNEDAQRGQARARPGIFNLR